MITRRATPQGIGDGLQGGAPGMRLQRRLVEDLVKIDLEGESYAWIDHHLPDKKDHLEKAVMPAIGAIDTEYIGCRRVARAQAPRHGAAPVLVKHKNPQMPQIKMAGDDVPHIGKPRFLHARVCYRDRHDEIHSCRGRQCTGFAFGGQRLVEAGKPIEDLVFLRPRIERDGMIIPEGLPAFGEAVSGRAVIRRDIG